MTIKIISAYISDDNKVIAIAKDRFYVYPYRLKKDRAELLVRNIISRGSIEDIRWEKHND